MIISCPDCPMVFLITLDSDTLENRSCSIKYRHVHIIIEIMICNDYGRTSCDKHF